MREDKLDNTAISNKKVLKGRVVSDKMNKTVVVEVERKFMQSTFKKVVRATKKYKVHDEKNECKVGDVILMTETRPLSKDKRWRLLEIIKKAEVIDEAAV